MRRNLRPRTSPACSPPLTQRSSTRATAIRTASCGPRTAACSRPRRRSRISRREFASLSPCGRGSLREAKRGEGFSPRANVYRLNTRIAPLIRRFAPPSPTRGEGQQSQTKRAASRPPFCKSSRTKLLRRELHVRRGRTDLGVDLGFKLGKVLLEHADQRARGLVEGVLVLPGVDRVEDLARHAR